MVEGMKDYRIFPEYAGGHTCEAYHWAQKEKPGIYSYRFVLRPIYLREAGYALDATQIKATGEEFMHSLLWMSRGMVREEIPRTILESNSMQNRVDVCKVIWLKGR
ncbi:hypothetical protein ACOMHN_053715 [Nucella lapillus]